MSTLTDQTPTANSTNQRGIRDVVAAWPKIDLHRHLEGSLRLSTLAEIAKEHGVDLPRWNLEAIRPYVQVVDEDPDFQGFLSKFKLLRRFYSTREAVMRIAYEAVADAATDNIKYLELRFNPVALAKVQGFGYEEVAEWVVSATNDAQQDYDIQTRLIAQIGRDERIDVAQQVAEVAAAFQDQGLVGIDLAGDEIGFSAARFAGVFQWAKAQGLYVTVHAAEAGHASNIREAVELLGADRIGHGVRAMEDLSVMDLIIRHNITLEMCPTSNLQTGVISSLGQHPLWAYQQVGIRVTINTDDPSISSTTLTDEYMVALRGIGIPLRGIRHMVLTAAQAAFLPDPERQRLVDWFHQALPPLSAGTLVKQPDPSVSLE
jgi:adenosine deaminase